MTKQKLHEEVLRLCTEHKAPEALVAKLSELTKPKVGGSADVNDYTCFDADGNVTHIFCNLHKKWEPLKDTEGNVLFKEDKKSKNGYFRDCNEGIKQFREADKMLKASKAAIMQEVLDEEITGTEAKEAIAELGSVRDNIKPREDGLGTDDKPCKGE